MVTTRFFFEIEGPNAGWGMGAIAGIFFYTMFGLLLMDVFGYLKDGVWNVSFSLGNIYFFGGGGLLFTLFTFLSRPSPPFRLNRVTQEMLLTDGVKVFRVPWKEVHARIDKAPNFRGASFSYNLGFGLSPGAGKPPESWQIVGGGMSEEEALRHWEFYCRYMESLDGYVELRETPEEEKSASRQHWDAEEKSLFIQIIFNVVFAPALWIGEVIQRLAKRFRKHTTLPQEMVDICEGNPLYQQWLQNEKGKGRWART